MPTYTCACYTRTCIDMYMYNVHVIAWCNFMCSATLLSSNPHSVSSLLVQQLLHHFSLTFLTTPTDTPMTSSRHHPSVQPGVDQVSLKEFLQDEMTVFLLLSIQTISMQVSYIQSGRGREIHVQSLYMYIYT